MDQPLGSTIRWTGVLHLHDGGHGRCCAHGQPTPVPPQEQGLLPIPNLRYPAIYGPTAEPVLVEGSLVQLGDDTISRKAATETVTMPQVPTKTVKITVWRDQWKGDWATFTKAPVRTVVSTHQRLMLCRGDRCGQNCQKWHPPVDAEVDGVLADVWGRAWMTTRGKKCPSEEADQFQVFARIPVVCMEGLQQTSSNDGIYYELRTADGRGPSEEMVVVWLPHLTLQEVQHKLRTLDRGIAVARFAGRYGIRALQRDGAQVHRDLNLEDDYNQITIQEVYEVRPLPHGIQKAGVTALLKKWNWQARPLQPYRGDQHGMGWLVGAAAGPPEPVLTTTDGDIMASLHRKQDQERPSPVVLGSNKTKNHMKNTKKQQEAPPGLDKENVAPSTPWKGRDPWGGWNPTGDAPMPDVSCQQALTGVPRQPLVDSEARRTQDGFKQETEQRFQRLETDLTEIKEQHVKYEQWFRDAGAANHQVQTQVQHLTTQVVQNQNEVQTQVQHLTTQIAQNQNEVQTQVQHLTTQVVQNQNEVQTQVQHLTTQIAQNQTEVQTMASKIDAGFSNLELLEDTCSLFGAWFAPSSGWALDQERPQVNLPQFEHIFHQRWGRHAGNLQFSNRSPRSSSPGCRSTRTIHRILDHCKWTSSLRNSWKQPLTGLSTLAKEMWTP
eukprot:Skav206969  [mRNA]  locus=scaffold255:597270:599261:+ [translate_table: standard]